MTTFQGINWTRKNFCQHLNLKGKTLLVNVNKLFVFSSVQKQNFFFSFLSGLLNGRKKSNFFKKAVEWIDSMKRNYGGFTFMQCLTIYCRWEKNEINCRAKQGCSSEGIYKLNKQLLCSCTNNGPPCTHTYT